VEEYIAGISRHFSKPIIYIEIIKNVQGKKEPNIKNRRDNN
jgi:hypothetical protein